MSDNQPEEIDYESMTDEEFNKLALPAEPTDEARAENPEGEPAEEVDAEVEDTPGAETEEAEVEESDGDEVNEEIADDDTVGEADESESDESTEGDVVDTPEVNLFEGLQELLKDPIKVGDAEITINSAEELVTLAKRGLGANKRIQDLAPKLKTLSMLETNGLMDQKKLNFLIALDKKDPAAIRQLVASSGVDAFEASTGDVDEDYIPEDRSVSDEQFAVQQAFSNIESTDTYQETLKSIDGFSASSKDEVRRNPGLIGQLSEHHENGYYQEIQGIVLKEKAMGRLTDLDGLQAYKHVWNKIQENSAGMGSNPEAGHKNTTNDRSSGENLAGKDGDPEAGHKANTGKRVGKAQQAAKKAAESTNKNRGSQKAESINFDELTDEEIMNLEVSDIFN